MAPEIQQIVDSHLARQAANHERRMAEDEQFTKVLMVAEKPSIAKAIAEALGGRHGARQRRGISRAIPVYEFTSDKFVPAGGLRCKVIVTSVVGHVFSLSFLEEKEEENEDGAPQQRRHAPPSAYFDLPVVKTEEATTGKLRVIEHLRAAAAGADHLVLWLDCDAEGENIAHEVIGVTRRALEMRAAQMDAPAHQQRVHRARFSAITPDALRDAFRALGEPDAALSRAVDARQELDLRVGVAMTRLLTWRCVGVARRAFSPSTKVISYGPCQTPTLHFCVARAREIEAFEPESFWRVNVTARGDGDLLELRWRGGERGEAGDETTDESLAARVVQQARASGRVRVLRVDDQLDRISPPVGLNTVRLLVAGSKAMGMSPKQVMNIAEKLYSAGFISYPRTESTRYDPNGFDVRVQLREHAKHPEWGKAASYLLRGKYANTGRPPKGGVDAGDHPPVTPVLSGGGGLPGGADGRRLYELVTRQFLASLCDDARLRVGRVALVAGGESFSCSGLEVIDEGWFRAMPHRMPAPVPLPRVQEGQVLHIVRLAVEAGTTAPPPAISESELIGEMERHGIGTDASIATHIKNVEERKYVRMLTGRRLEPTPLGLALVQGYRRIDPELVLPTVLLISLRSRPELAPISPWARLNRRELALSSP